MDKILIAFNNYPSDVLHDFSESCADEAKQICFDTGIKYSSVYPPDLREQNVINEMPNHKLCFFAGHGDADGIYNEIKEAIVSIDTTNYNFKNKGFYSVACLCAQKLHPHLKSLDLLFFVGYNNTFNVRGELTPFINSALSGLKSFLNGDTLKVAKEKMIATYDDQISKLDKTDPMAAVLLMQNKEALVFDGNDELLFSDLE